MRLLGAVLAGGRSSRFGSDKALAMLDGRPLIRHVIDALAAQVTAVAVVGRDWPGCARIEDWPLPGLGPLGALAGALGYAADHGFDAVLSAGCDMPGLPADLAQRLGRGPSVAAGHWLVGCWPTVLADSLRDRLRRGGDRSMRGWAATCDARIVDCGTLRDINVVGTLTTSPR